MHLIGASLLTDYGDEHRDALPAIQALAAVIRNADWKEPAAVRRQFQAIGRVHEHGRIVIEVAHAQLRVALDVHYGSGVVRIASVSGLDGTEY